MEDKDLRANLLEEEGNDINPSTKHNKKQSKVFEGQKKAQINLFSSSKNE